MENIKRANLTTEFMSHPLTAWAGLLRFELLNADSEHGTERRAALFVLDRDGWDGLSLLFTKVRELLPDVSIWLIAESLAIEVYSGFTHKAGVPDPIALATDLRETMQAKQGLRIVGHEPEPDPPAAAPSSAAMEESDEPEPDPDAIETTAVSSEELAMLLELFDEEPQKPKRDARDEDSTPQDRGHR